jgi:hypothetical protein
VSFSIVQSATHPFGSGFSVSFANPVASGNMVIVWAQVYQAQSTFSLADDKGNTYNAPTGATSLA